MITAAQQSPVNAMMSLPILRRSVLPAPARIEMRETFLHIALVGMTITVTALLGYIALRDADEALEQELPPMR